jgi:carbonic anhydrase
MPFLRNNVILIHSVKPRSAVCRMKCLQHFAFTTFVESSKQGKDSSPHVEKLLSNNRKWVEARTKHDKDYFVRLGKGQQPKYLYFGCSDSLVPLEVLGLEPGEVLVHRNVGNLVPSNDLNALSVLEFGVTHLGITDIIVAGHYQCGAIRAATSRQDLGTLENWLRLIRDVYRLHKLDLDKIKDDNELLHRKLVQLNVIEQCLNIYKAGVVQRTRLQTRDAAEVTPRIHGMVFDPSNGIMSTLPIDYETRIGSLDRIYGNEAT